jgi:hypothetical protein
MDWVSSLRAPQIAQLAAEHGLGGDTQEVRSNDKQDGRW